MLIRELSDGTRLCAYDIRHMDGQTYQTAFAQADKEKQAVVIRLRSEQAKKCAVAGDMLAREEIARRCGVRKEDIVFQKNEYGKPFAQALRVQFNISHSGDMVLCAVSDDPVGVDVEKVRPVRLKTAKRICTEQELRYLFGKQPTEEDYLCDDQAVLQRFFEIWCAKEAYFKCIGTGIRAPQTADITFLLGAPHSFYLGGYQACLCVQKEEMSSITPTPAI